MDIKEFRNVIQEREKCHDEWAFGLEKCWNKEIEILTEDIESSIEFLKTECTSEEFGWISEVLDDVLVKTNSRKFYDAYKSLVDKYPDECKKSNIIGVIELAEGILKWEDEHGKGD